jgi:hypothetical protein
MALLRTRTRNTVQDLARALRAGDDADAARLAAELGLPRGCWHTGGWAAGTVPMDAAAPALAVVEALAESAPSRGIRWIPAPRPGGTGWQTPQVLDLVADLAAFDVQGLQGRYDLEAEKDRFGDALEGIRPLSAAS